MLLPRMKSGDTVPRSRSALPSDEIEYRPPAGGIENQLGQAII
ncbi:hypothetical protein QE390_003066 [Siphonobacter sp. SORGH_AS 1065]|nr:hypothetical protein [Siphonobacter sp. SORGH_AS_1065]